MRLLPAFAVILFAASPCAAQLPTALRSASTDSTGAPVSSRFQSTSSGDARERGALIGLGIGTITGLLVDTVRLFAAPDPPVCTTSPCTSDQARLSPPFGTSMLIGGGAGLIIGAIIGSFHQESSIGFSVMPDARGALTVSAHRVF